MTIVLTLADTRWGNINFASYEAVADSDYPDSPFAVGFILSHVHWPGLRTAVASAIARGATAIGFFGRGANEANDFTDPLVRANASKPAVLTMPFEVDEMAEALLAFFAASQASEPLGIANYVLVTSAESLPELIALVRVSLHV